MPRSNKSHKQVHKKKVLSTKATHKNNNALLMQKELLSPKHGPELLPDATLDIDDKISSGEIIPVIYVGGFQYYHDAILRAPIRELLLDSQTNHILKCMALRKEKPTYVLLLCNKNEGS